jgi:hypothetical protein
LLRFIIVIGLDVVIGVVPLLFGRQLIASCFPFLDGGVEGFLSDLRWALCVQ